jgi:hypothetical protein
VVTEITVPEVVTGITVLVNSPLYVQIWTLVKADNGMAGASLSYSESRK